MRSLRLRALADAPDAFGTTSDEASREPPEYWEGRARTGAGSDTTIIVIAAECERWLGMARGDDEGERPPVVEIASVWVDPSKRRSGVAQAMLAAIERWANDRGAAALHLWVTDTNSPARALYARLGFVDTGQTAPVRPGSALREMLMVRELAR